MRALCLALLLWPGAALAQRSTLVLHCGSCLGLWVDLDQAHLFFAGGLGSAGWVNGRPAFSTEARLAGLSPGPHHLRVTMLQGPLDTQVDYDGPIYLRPSREVHMRVAYGSLADFREEVLPDDPPDAGPPYPDGGLPDAGPAPPDAGWPRTDGGLPMTTLVIRAEDQAGCALALDGELLLELEPQQVARTRPLWPGRHRLEVRPAQGGPPRSGWVFLASGEELVGGVECQSGRLELYSHPRAYLADPAPPDGGATSR